MLRGIRWIQRQLWSYGSVNHPGTFNYPAFTIEANYRIPVRVKWINDLVDSDGNYLRTSCRWTRHSTGPTRRRAEPAPNGTGLRDSRPTFSSTPGPYTGPVPIVTICMGGTAQESDGYAEAWFLPAANSIPSGFATEGTWYNSFKEEFQGKSGVIIRHGDLPV